MAKHKQFPAVLGVDEHCAVCGRVQFGRVQVLSFGHWRHEECVPGSVNWVDAYITKSKTERNEYGDILLKWANEGRPR